MLSPDSLVAIFWLIVSAGIAVAGMLTLMDTGPWVPDFVRHLTLYGKFRTLHHRDHHRNESSNWNKLNQLITTMVHWLQIPKSCFRYFYLVSLMATIIVMVNTTNDKSSSFWLLAIGQLIQSIRRSYETWRIAIFSPTNRINAVHFIIGILFYLSTAYATWRTATENGSSLIFSLTIMALFTIASVIQYQSHVILANVRRKSGKQQTSNYRYEIPRGGLFHLVACPHYLAEMIIYYCWWELANRTFLWSSLWLFVLVNQTVAALMAHRWYRQTFAGKYPANIRAVIPFVL